MLAQVHSFLLQGIDAIACEVEVDVVHDALPKTFVVGLPDAAVKESVERVRSAVTNTGYPFALARTVINLAPADKRKEGPVYDLPIAVGILLSENVIQTDRHRRLMFAGELALDGRVRPVAGVINLALLCKQLGLDGVVVPTDNAHEAAAVDGIEVYPADTLASVVGFLNGQYEIVPVATVDVDDVLRNESAPVDFAEIRGQEAVKRAMTVAAAGGHNIMMMGPAGTGKTMAARALPGILPPFSRDEALQVTRIYSAVGQVPRGQSLITARPVRTPHHTASAAAVIGGGTVPRPGEVSLAHHGILFLDEMPEFPRPVLETLRQPLEDGHVTIARAHSAIRFPAQFMLVAALNPTPKGDKPTDAQSRKQMDRYLARLSGPLIDRIDIHVEVPPVPYKQLTGQTNGTGSTTIRRQVLQARERQYHRNGGPLRRNALLTGRELDRFAPMDDGAQDLIRQAMSELSLSARAYDKIRRVARTLADLDASEGITMQHAAEAISYRLLDRGR